MEAATTNRQQLGERLLRILFFTLMISVTNLSVFNVVLSNISQEFGITSSKVSWVITGYMIFYSVGVVIYGKLADRYRLKDLLTFGIVFMALGSIVGFVATDYWMIVVGRMLQAIGAAVIPATGMIIPVRYFSPENRGRAIGTAASGIALGNAVAPIISGFMTSLFGWRALFCLSLLALLTLPFYRKYLDDERGSLRSLDILGGALLAGTMALMLLSITMGSWILLVLGLILLALFILRIRFADEPFIQPAFFRNKPYTLGILITLFGTFISYGILFITPQLLANVNQISPALIGFVMFPGAIAAALLARLGGGLADHRGDRSLFYVAALLQFISFGMLSITAGMSPILVSISLVFGNVGQSFMLVAMSGKISRSLAREQAGVGMGLFQMLNFIAVAMSTTVIGKVLDYGPSLQLNALLMNPRGLAFSNIFFVLAFLVLMNVYLFYILIGKSSADSRI